MRALPIFLLFCLFILGCTAPESNTEKTSPTPQTTPVQSPLQTTPKPVETPITTPLTTPSEEVQDLGIDNMEKELYETEQMLSELETLENVSFDI